MLGPLEPLRLVLRENGGLVGVDVANGPLELEPNPPEDPRFKLADLLTGIRLPYSSGFINNINISLDVSSLNGIEEE